MIVRTPWEAITKKKMFKLYRLGKCTKEQLDYFIKLKRLILDLYFCLYK